jgi:peptide/nickel transport system substrate-binding protein
VQATDPGEANALWARIDRELTDEAPWLFLYNRKQADFVSSRVGNSSTTCSTEFCWTNFG